MRHTQRDARTSSPHDGPALKHMMPPLRLISTTDRSAASERAATTVSPAPASPASSPAAALLGCGSGTCGRALGAGPSRCSVTCRNRVMGDVAVAAAAAAVAPVDGAGAAVLCRRDADIAAIDDERAGGVGGTAGAAAGPTAAAATAPPPPPPPLPLPTPTLPPPPLPPPPPPVCVPATAVADTCSCSVMERSLPSLGRGGGGTTLRDMGATGLSPAAVSDESRAPVKPRGMATMHWRCSVCGTAATRRRSTTPLAPTAITTPSGSARTHTTAAPLHPISLADDHGDGRPA